MSKREAERRERLLPGGIPRYVHIYDNWGKSLDQYTVVYTGNYTKRTGGEHQYMCMNSSPFWGICQHGSSRYQIDYPTYGHLGKKIRFTDLPKDCQTVVMRDYLELWDLNEKEN